MFLNFTLQMAPNEGQLYSFNFHWMLCKRFSGHFPIKICKKKTSYFHLNEGISYKITQSLPYSGKKCQFCCREVRETINSPIFALDTNNTV